jgi:DNA-binding transcriptional LysR family regulator
MISAVALRYFGEVVRAGSIRAASERLYVAASAISRQLALLEDEVGAPLLERGRGRTALRLTAAGELMVRYLRQSEHEMDRVRSEIESLKGLRKGHIRLGIPETFVREVVPQVLQRFNRRHPGVTFRVEVAASPRLVQLISGNELDVAVTFNPPAALHVKHVFERQLATCVLLSTDHPLADRPHLKLSDCADYGLALPDETMSAKQAYEEMFARARIRPRKVLETNSYELMRAVAAAGMAITIVNARPGDAPATASYRYIPIQDPRVKPQRVTICTPGERNPGPVASVFIEQLKQEFEQLDHS